MFIDQKDFRVQGTTERSVVRRFVEQLDELIEEQPGCLGVESWGTGDRLYVVSGWQDRRQAEAATQVIGPYVQSGASGRCPISGTVSRALAGDQSSVALLDRDHGASAS